MSRRLGVGVGVGVGQVAEVMADAGGGVTIVLNNDELATLASYAATARWPGGFPVYQRGAVADGVFVVRQGCVVLRTRLKGGRAFVPRMCGIGEVFGAEGLAAGGVYQTDARAEGESLTLHVSRRRLRTLLCEQASTAIALAEQVGVAHGQLLERLRELSMLSVEQRLLAAIGRARALRPAMVAGEPLILNAAGYRLLCEMVGATRESVTLALGRLMSDGLAERDGGRVVISAASHGTSDMSRSDSNPADTSATKPSAASATAASATAASTTRRRERRDGERRSRLTS